MTTVAAIRYRALVDGLGAIVWEASPGRRAGEATFSFVSEGTEPLLGYSPERWTSDPRFWFEIIEPEDRERVNGEIVACVTGRRGGDFEYRARAADGRVVWLRNIVQYDESASEPRLSGVLIDVTQRKTAEGRLIRLQEFTGALGAVLNAREVAAVVAARGREAVGAAGFAVLLLAGNGELEMVGYEGPAPPGPGESRRIPLDHDGPAAEAVRTGAELVLDDATLRARFPRAAIFRRLPGEGQVVALPLIHGERTLGAIVLRLEPDAPLGPSDRVVLEVLRRASVSALVRAEQALAERDSRAVLDAIITTAPEGFALFDRDLRFVRVNDALAAINGLPAADHVGRSVTEVLPDLPESSTVEPLRRVLETGEPIVELEVTRHTGAQPTEQQTWLVSYYPVHDADGAIGWLGAFVVDITHRKRAEERSQFLAELGTILDAAVSVEARMDNLVGALVPSLCSFAAVALRTPSGGLERAVSRGEEAPGTTAALRVRGRDLGELTMTFTRPVPDEADEAFAGEVARRAALAIDNASLYEAEQLARARTERQYRVAAALAEALTPADVARTTLDELLGALGAPQGTLWLIDDEQTELELIGWEGFPDEAIRGYERASLAERRPSADAARTRKLVFLSDADEIIAAYPEWGQAILGGGLRTIAVFPLMTPGRTVGVLYLSSDQPHAFGPDDIALGTALAAQAAQALERARLYERERRVSVTLQRSLLPAELPAVAGLEIDLRYVPAAGLEAGGDFYEAVALPDGDVIVAVGDVVGRGATAAAAMGQLRSALRAYALAGEAPAQILARMSTFADTVPEAMAATAVVAKLDATNGRLIFACAGHPWPLLIGPEGECRFLEGGRGVPLGCVQDPAYEEAEVTLAPGGALLLYTDGLTERRGQDLDAVMERIRQAAAGAARAPLATLLDSAVAAAGVDAPNDDVALVALRYTGAASVSQLSFPAVIEQVPVARHAIRDWLSREGVAGSAAADLLLASGEAIANAVEHSGTDRVEVDLAQTAAGTFAVVVRDFGGWKDPVVSSHRGRGFGLMRALTHDCRIERGKHGTVVRLTHRVTDFQAPTPGLPPPQACRVTVTEDGSARLAGELDLACARRVANELVAADIHTVDLSGVTHLDSAGARMLFELPGRPAFLAPLDSPPRRALELSGLAGVMRLSEPPA